MKALLILLIVVCVAGLIALVAYLIHRATHPKLKEEKPDEQQCVKEELDRVLVPVDDDKTAEAISNYREKEDEEPASKKQVEKKKDGQ